MTDGHSIDERVRVDLRTFFEAVSPGLAEEQKLIHLIASFKQKGANGPMRWPENLFAAIRKRRGVDLRELCAYIRGEPAWRPTRGNYLPPSSSRRRKSFKIKPAEPTRNDAGKLAGIPDDPICRYFCVIAPGIQTSPGALRSDSGLVVGSDYSQQLSTGRVVRVYQVTAGGMALTECGWVALRGASSEDAATPGREQLREIAGGFYFAQGPGVNMRSPVSGETLKVGTGGSVCPGPSKLTVPGVAANPVHKSLRQEFRSKPWSGANTNSGSVMRAAHRERLVEERHQDGDGAVPTERQLRDSRASVAHISNVHSVQTAAGQPPFGDGSVEVFTAPNGGNTMDDATVRRARVQKNWTVTAVEQRLSVPAVGRNATLNADTVDAQIQTSPDAHDVRASQAAAFSRAQVDADAMSSTTPAALRSCEGLLCPSPIHAQRSWQADASEYSSGLGSDSGSEVGESFAEPQSEVGPRPKLEPRPGLEADDRLRHFSAKEFAMALRGLTEPSLYALARWHNVHELEQPDLCGSPPGALHPRTRALTEVRPTTCHCDGGPQRSA
jgi:hypothetical protein